MDMNTPGRLADRQRPDRVAVMNQSWEHLLFLHWRFEPAVVQKRLPRGLCVDTLEGAAWVGLTPLFLRRVHPRFVPPIPFISNFYELNVRTYVCDPQGRAGIYVFSMDCDQPLVVETGRRLLHLHYEHAQIEAAVWPDGWVDFASRRQHTTAIDRFRYKPDRACGLEVAPDSLEFFLMERYRLYVDIQAELSAIRVHHAPYRLILAQCPSWGESVLRLAGLPPPARPPDHICAAEPMDVEIFLPRSLDEPS
jgi:uncharacterized protein YqjF (DUF2071 family)